MINMPKINIERYWPDDIREHAKDLSSDLEKMDFQAALVKLNKLLDILKDPLRDGKSRVSVAFIIDQIKMIDPFVDLMVNALKEVLKEEKDEHVKEFAVWALGEIVQESRNLELIKETMPLFIKFCTDTSEHVKKFAINITDRLNIFIEQKKHLDEKIKQLLEKLNALIQDRINEMNERAKILSKEALALDYKAAFERRTEMEGKIRQFKDKNAESEDEILAFQSQLVREEPAFKGESRDIINHWREIRGEKEALIRRVHCILRIQGKIYRIITHIKNKSDGKIDINELKEETQYSDHEIIEILKKLVDEEILPNFMIDMVGGSLAIQISPENNLIQKEEQIAKQETKNKEISQKETKEVKDTKKSNEKKSKKSRK